MASTEAQITIPQLESKSGETKALSPVERLLFKRAYIRQVLTDRSHHSDAFGYRQYKQEKTYYEHGHTLIYAALEAQDYKTAFKTAYLFPDETERSKALYDVAVVAFANREMTIAANTLAYQKDERLREKTVLIPLRINLEEADDIIEGLSNTMEFFGQMVSVIENKKRMAPQVKALLLSHIHAFTTQHPNALFHTELIQMRDSLQNDFLIDVDKLKQGDINSFISDLASSPDPVVRLFVQDHITKLSSTQSHLKLALEASYVFYETSTRYLPASEQEAALSLLDQTINAAETTFTARPHTKGTKKFTPTLLFTLLYRGLAKGEGDQNTHIAIATDVGVHHFVYEQKKHIERALHIFEHLAVHKIKFSNPDRAQIHRRLLQMGAFFISMGDRANVERIKQLERQLFPEVHFKSSSPISNIKPVDIAGNIMHYLENYQEHEEEIIDSAARGHAMLGNIDRAYRHASSLVDPVRKTATHIRIIQLIGPSLRTDTIAEKTIEYVSNYLKVRARDVLGRVATEVLPAYLSAYGPDGWIHSLEMIEATEQILSSPKLTFLTFVAGGIDTPLFLKIAPLLFTRTDEYPNQDIAHILKSEGVPFSHILQLYLDPDFVKAIDERQLEDCLRHYYDIRLDYGKQQLYEFFKRAHEIQKPEAENQTEDAEQFAQQIPILGRVAAGEQLNYRLRDRMDTLNALISVSTHMKKEDSIAFWKEFWQLREQLIAITDADIDWSQNVQRAIPILKWLNGPGKNADYQTQMLFLARIKST